MLFYGPPGTGKTSTILALAKELFGPEIMKSRVLELNASDERGISIVRDKIKNFARITVSHVPFDQRSYPCPPYKIVILDEADSMTSDAQSALRRTMELYSKTTRFCLICNYITRIIDPISSRCAKFRFKPLDETNALSRLQYIASKESLVYEPKTLETVLQSSDGDLRKSITFLQSAARLTSNISQMTPHIIPENATTDSKSFSDLHLTNAITVNIIHEIAGVIPDDVINGLISSCKNTFPINGEKPSFKEGMFDKIITELDTVVLNGWSATQILCQMHEILINDDTYSSSQKMSISWELSESDKRLSDGTDEYIEILDFLLKFSQIVSF